MRSVQRRVGLVHWVPGVCQRCPSPKTTGTSLLGLQLEHAGEGENGHEEVRPEDEVHMLQLPPFRPERLPAPPPVPGVWI